MDFGEAIKKIKEGKKLRRMGWNGKNQHVELASDISFLNSDGLNERASHQNIESKCLVFYGNLGIQVGWLATQSDMLAEDWVEI